MNDGQREEARRAIEAILMVADDPVDPHLLAQLVEISATELSQLMSEMATYYEETGRGFELAQIAGGYRFQSHHAMAPYVERFVLEGQHARLSAAAMETLAIIAYKQPISRAQVAAIRGVNVDGVCRTLEGRGYIAEVARDSGPGQAVLFGTTDQFLERMGINSVEDLPSVSDFVPGADVVEALEHGLRFDADEHDSAEAALSDEDEADGADDGADEAEPHSDAGEAQRLSDADGTQPLSDTVDTEETELLGDAGAESDVVEVAAEIDAGEIPGEVVDVAGAAPSSDAEPTEPDFDELARAIAAAHEQANVARSDAPEPD